MDDEIKSRLRLLHSSLCQQSGDQSVAESSFRDCMKTFRSINDNAVCPDEFSNLNRIKRLLSHSNTLEIFSQDIQVKRLESLFQELQNAGTLTKVPELLEFLRVLAGSNAAFVSDTLWHNASDFRTNQVSSPESGFATTPADMPLGGSFPGASVGGGKLVPFPDSKMLLKPPPPSRLLCSQPCVTESELIRDLMAVVQGYNGELVKQFPDGCRMAHGKDIDSAMRDVALQIGYSGWLCSKLKSYCLLKQNDAKSGLCSQKLCNVVQEELQRYRKNVSSLYAKLHRDDPDGSWKEHTNRSDQLTLRKFNLAMWEHRDRLYYLYKITEAEIGCKGGQLVTILNKFAHHGNPVIQLLISNLIYAAVEPLLIQIRRWVFSGILDDSFHEFFVAQDAIFSNDVYWSNRFQFRDMMVPYFLSTDFAQQLFMGGKSIAFIRNFCHVHKPIPGLEKYLPLSDCTFAGRDPLWDFEQNQIKPEHITAFREACRIATHSVVNLLREEHNIGAHFQGLQKFFLMGQGDFILSLMDSLKDSLNEPAEQLYLRNLTATLNDAIRSTNAQYVHPDVLKCLDTAVVPLGSNELGWEAFLLEYRVKEPLATVLTKETIARYRQIFGYLWRVKRAEFLLAELWRDQMCSRVENNGIPGDFRNLAHETRLMLHRMMHFVQQLQYCYDVEVLQIGWNQFLNKISKAGSLDDLLTFHADFLNLIEEKFFIPTRTSQNPDPAIYLRAALDHIVKFESFYGDFQYAARCELTNLVEDPDPDFSSEFYLKTVPELYTRLHTLQACFKGEVCHFITLLEAHEKDPLIRCRMDYNGNYIEAGKKAKQLDALNAAGFDDSPNS